MLHQPDPEKKPDLLQGLITIRQMFLKIMEDTGFPLADEMLYPENARYFSDCLSYVAVGARSVEDQQHRLTASGMDIPVGMKNPTSGDLSIMLNSIEAAQSSHSFLYRGWMFRQQVTIWHMQFYVVPLISTDSAFLTTITKIWLTYTKCTKIRDLLILL